MILYIYFLGKNQLLSGEEVSQQEFEQLQAGLGEQQGNSSIGVINILQCNISLG